MLFTNKDILKLAVPCGIQLCAGTGGNADFRRDPARPQHGCNGRLVMTVDWAVRVTLYAWRYFSGRWLAVYDKIKQ